MVRWKYDKGLYALVEPVARKWMPMEKQNTVENQLAHTITQTEFDSDYDKTAKKLLANKQILAQIMKAE